MQMIFLKSDYKQSTIILMSLDSGVHVRSSD